MDNVLNETPKPSCINFHVPTKPYSAVDAINRIAAATGSIGYAMAASDADYNGHRLNLYFNNYRGYYVADYNWGERVVIARGENFADVLLRSLDWFKRQGRGASIWISVLEKDATILHGCPEVVAGPEDIEASGWYNWRHKNASHALWMERHFGIPVFALLCARDEEDFKFLTSNDGRAEISKRKIEPEAQRAGVPA